MIDSLIDAFVGSETADQEYGSTVTSDPLSLMAVLDQSVGSGHDSLAGLIFDYTSHDASAQLAAVLAT